MQMDCGACCVLSETKGIQAGFGLVSLWLYFCRGSRHAGVLFIVSIESPKKEGLILKKNCTGIGLPLCFFLTLELSRFYLSASRSTAWLHSGWTTVDKACVVVSNSLLHLLLIPKNRRRITHGTFFFCSRPQYFLL